MPSSPPALHARYRSAALQSNALHFASDLAGSTAVLLGLVLARAGYPVGDAIAALFVSVLVILAAVRLMRGNVDVLMDSVPDEAEAAARAAIAELRGWSCGGFACARPATGSSRTS